MPPPYARELSVPSPPFVKGFFDSVMNSVKVIFHIIMYEIPPSSQVLFNNYISALARGSKPKSLMQDALIGLYILQVSSFSSPTGPNQGSFFLHFLFLGLCACILTLSMASNCLIKHQNYLKLVDNFTSWSSWWSRN